MGPLIPLLIMVGSLAGIGFLLWRKIPLLLELPPEEASMRELVQRKLQKIARAHSIQPKKFLDTMLSKARTLARLVARQASKTETQTSKLLEKLRTQSETRKEEFKESYWEKLRKKSRRK